MFGHERHFDGGVFCVSVGIVCDVGSVIIVVVVVG